MSLDIYTDLEHRRAIERDFPPRHLAGDSAGAARRPDREGVEGRAVLGPAPLTCLSRSAALARYGVPARVLVRRRTPAAIQMPASPA